MSTTAEGLGTESFSKWRAYLWPVHRYELKKLLPMLGIFFLISFDYNILRVLKDTLVIHAKGSGAEAIPFIKVWVMFPSAILMTLFFTKLSSTLQRERVFYIITGIFLGYFALYNFILYPMRHLLHPEVSADYFESLLPLGFKGFIALYRNWTCSVFYVMAELWSSMVLFVLFWGFANQVTRLCEAKRFYGLFGIGANFSGVVAGQASVFLTEGDFNPALPFGATAWDQSLHILLFLVVGAGLAALALFRWMQKNVLTDARFYDDSLQGELENKNASQKVSLRDALQFLLRSRYVLCIAIIVLCYNMVINLTEVLWKDAVKELYPDPNHYNIYMNQVSSVIGIFATLSSLLLTGNAIRSCGWTFTALLTPIVLFVTSIGFFGFLFLNENSTPVLFWGMTPLALVVLFGSAQNILSRAAKYSVFDATKEMAYIPLDADTRVKSKAAIDGIGSRLGKSGGSFIHQGLFLASNSLAAGAPIVAVVLFCTIALWAGAIYLLGLQFRALAVPQERPAARFVATAPLLQEQQAVG